MKKIGLALAGGGARGAFQIGAWKALIELGIIDKISAYSGASVGSLNAALFAMGDYETAKEVWLTLEKDSLFNIEKHIYKRIYKQKLKFLDQGVYSTNKLEELLDDTVQFEKLRDKEVYVAATHLGNEKSTFFDLININYKHYFKAEKQVTYHLLRDLKPSEIKKVLLASCAIPIIFRPITIGGETFYDGGILDNTPYQPLIDAGCEVIIIIDLFKKSFIKKKAIEGASLVTINPKHSLRGILDFNNKYIYRRFEQGYIDTLEKLSKHLDLFE